jgi:hypothetical protein
VNEPATDIAAQESVRRWLASRRGLWGDTGDDARLLDALRRFCERNGKTPDAMIDECLRRPAEGGAFVLRTRARREYIRLIDAFEKDEGSRAAGNAVRSFFIHNGVAMNPSILR